MSLEMQLFGLLILLPCTLADWQHPPVFIMQPQQLQLNM